MNCLLRFLCREDRPKITFRDREPYIPQFLNGVWVYEDDQHTVRRLFFRLLRDHCGQEFADFAFTILNESLLAWAKAHPPRVKPSYDFDQKRLHPANVRTGEELRGRPLAEVEEEIESNAAVVAEECAELWTSMFRQHFENRGV